MNERWSSVDEVAEYLGVVQNTAYRRINNRGLPAEKIGRLCKLALSKVDDRVYAGGTHEPVHRQGEGARPR
jgi:excisionase family DNA binding protein